MKSRFRTQYDSTVGIDPGIECTLEERKTQSEFAEDCDVNLLVARYRKTGVMPDVTQRASEALYGDFSAIPSRMEMFNIVENAWDAFNALPPDVRREFNNDAAEFLAATETLEGVERLKKVGLGKPTDPVKTPLEASVAPSAAGQAAPPEPQTAPSKTKTVKDS